MQSHTDTISDCNTCTCLGFLHMFLKQDFRMESRCAGFQVLIVLVFLKTMSV